MKKIAMFDVFLLAALILLPVAPSGNYSPSNSAVESNLASTFIGDGSPRPPLPPALAFDGSPRLPLPPSCTVEASPRPRSLQRSFMAVRNHLCRLQGYRPKCEITDCQPRHRLDPLAGAIALKPVLFIRNF
jgi:hypothetical protein